MQRGARKEHRHRRRADHAAADRLLDRRARGELPAEPDVDGEQHARRPPCRSRRRRASRRRRPACATPGRAGHRAEPVPRRRQLQRQLDEQPPEQPEHDQPPQPAVHLRPDRQPRPAAAARLQDRHRRARRSQTNRISQQNDEITLQSTSVDTQANVRNAYWDLVYAIQAVEAAQNSLDLAASWCRTTRRASKSARWRRSTSCRRRRKRPTGGRRWCRRRRRSAPRSSR